MAAISGAVGGLYGAAAMSVLRLGMHRAGLIDKMVPQAVEEWISHRIGLEPPGGKAGHNVADQLLHLGYGASLGALAGPLLTSRGGRAGSWRGAALGLATWTAGMLVLPYLRVTRPPWRAGVPENVVNIVAHLIFGAAVQLLVEEPAHQRGRARTSDREREASRVG